MITNFTKDMLKDGMVVETVEKKRYLVNGNRLLNSNGETFLSIEYYKNNLNCYDDNEHYEIVKIYDTIDWFNQMKDENQLFLIWERTMENKTYVFTQNNIDERHNDTHTITIQPNWHEGYSSKNGETNMPIFLKDTNNRDIDDTNFIGLTIDTAQKIADALNEIVKYVENKE